MPFDAGSDGHYLPDDTNVFLSSEQIHQASLTVCLHAQSIEERIDFLEMLGLIKEDA